MYKGRAKLKHFRISDSYPDSTVATPVESGQIYLNENLTSYRWNILKQANQMQKDGSLTSVWSMDSNIRQNFPGGRYDQNLWKKLT